MTNEQRDFIEKTIEGMRPGQDLSLEVFAHRFKDTVRVYDIFVEAQRVLHNRARFYDFVKKDPIQMSIIHYRDIGG